jgi:hypothetical protein
MTADERADLEAEDAARTSVPGEEDLQAPDGADEDERRLTEEERAALLREQLKALRVVDVAHDMLLSLVTLGYQKLGLTDETAELRNLEDARLAIDLVRSVIDVIGAAAGEPLVAPFRSTLAAMQLNFARIAAPPDAAQKTPAAEAAEGSEIGEEAGGSQAGDPDASASAGADGEPDASGQGD